MMRPHARNHANRDFARALRSSMSISEKVLWGWLRRDRYGVRFRRQVAVGPYVLDFYCGKAGLCVEVDGEQHEQRLERDAARDQWLAEQGIEVLRIPSLWLFETVPSGRAEAMICDALSRRLGRKIEPPW